MYKDLLLPQAVQLFLSSIENKNEEQAIALLDKEEIQAFVKAHLNEPINCKPNGGMAPIHQSFLMFASENGLPKLVKKLIGMGADVNLHFDPALFFPSNLSTSALALASRQGHLPVVQILIENDANVNSGWHSYISPQSFFVTHGNAKAGYSHTSPIFDCLRANQFDVAKYLLSKGATFNLTDEQWEEQFQIIFGINMPWQPSIGDKEKDTVLTFIDLYNYFADLQFSADIANNKKEQMLIQVFHKAIWKNQFQLVKMLADKYPTLLDSFNISQYSHHDWSDEKKSFYTLPPDSTGEYAVECAIRAKNFGILQLLFEKGAKLNTSNICYNGLYAQNSSSIKGLNSTGIFKNSHCDITELHYFASIGDEELEHIKKLLKNGNLQLQAKDKWGRTPFDIALANKQCKTMQLFIENGASTEPLIKWKENHKSNLLHFLLTHDNDNISCFHALGDLIDQKIIDVNEKDSYGRTPLMTASYYSTLKATQFLVKHGALTDPRENTGYNALDIAVDNGNIETANFFLGLEFKLEPYHLKMAELNQNSGMVQWLELKNGVREFESVSITSDNLINQVCPGRTASPKVMLKLPKPEYWSPLFHAEKDCRHLRNNLIEPTNTERSKESFSKQDTTTSFSTYSSLGITHFQAAPTDTSGSNRGSITTTINSGEALSGQTQPLQPSSDNTLSETMQNLKM